MNVNRKSRPSQITYDYNIVLIIVYKQVGNGFGMNLTLFEGQRMNKGRCDGEGKAGGGGGVTKGKFRTDVSGTYWLS